LKIAIVGGGSTYTPELVDGIARLGLPVTELVLVDPVEDRLETVGAFARRLLAGLGHPAALVTTTDLDAGVADADAVLLQLRVGGQKARHGDETLPLECGCIGQETTGVGGLGKALRTVPVVLKIAERVAELAPRAWVIDFTNPVGIVTKALLDAGHRAIGLCNVALGMRTTIADHLGVDADSLLIDHVGLNHLTWTRSAVWDGRDMLPQLLQTRGAELSERVGLPVSLLRNLGVIPSYYLRFFYAHDIVLDEQRRNPSRAEKVEAIENELLAMYADPAVTELPQLLKQRGGAHYSEAAVQLISAVAGNTHAVHVANTRNAGVFPFLPDDAVIEVPAEISAEGARALPVAPLDPLFAGLVAHVSAYEQLALDAALHGGLHRVERALLAHPLIGQAALAEPLAARLISANAEYLPWAR